MESIDFTTLKYMQRVSTANQPQSSILEPLSCFDSAQSNLLKDQHSNNPAVIVNHGEISASDQPSADRTAEQKKKSQRNEMLMRETGYGSQEMASELGLHNFKKSANAPFPRN